MPITTTIQDRIAEIVFDVPPVNAFDSETWMALPAIITAAASNPEVNCVLIRAAEEARGFCGGVDIKEMQAHPERITVLNRGNYLTFKAIRDAEVPVVVAVHRFVIGGGIGICGASDTIIAADDAWLSPFHQRECGSIAVHAWYKDDHDWMFRLVEPILREANGRPHWSKLHSLDANELQHLYPMFREVARMRRSVDRQGRMMNPFLHRVFGDA